MKQQNGNTSLAVAMTLLINNQAAMVAQQTIFLKAMAEIQKDFVEIRKDLETIKAVLIRHEDRLEKLEKAVREKIGFKQ